MRKTINERLFAISGNVADNIANARSLVAQITVPIGECWVINRHKLTAYIVRKETVALAETAGRTYYDFVPTAPARIPQLPNGMPLGSFVHAWFNNAVAAVTDITYNANGTETVRITVDGTAANLEVYHVFYPGTLDIRAEAPTGAAGYSLPLYTNALDVLGVVNQYQFPIEMSDNIVLPELYNISVYLTSPLIWSKPLPDTDANAKKNYTSLNLDVNLLTMSDANMLAKQSGFTDAKALAKHIFRG